jgi:2-phosphosulfolactate phosphatase
MNVDVVLLPRDLQPQHLRDRSVAVFDVLRATTTMAAALAAGVSEIRLFGDLESARAAADAHGSARVLCGEQACLPPPDFDLGNSPGGFSNEKHRDATVYMSTTNGTRALLAARAAPLVITAALVNAAAAARMLAKAGHDVTLLCAGTNGEVAMEDVVGAGAVAYTLAMLEPVTLASDAARMAVRLFRCGRDDVRELFRDAAGGRNVIAAGLEEDIDFAAGLDSIDVVGVATGDPLTVRRA